VSLTRSQHITSAGVDRDSKLPYKFKLPANAAVTIFCQKPNTSVTGKIERFLFAIAGAHRVLGRLGTSYTRETWDRSRHHQQIAGYFDMAAPRSPSWRSGNHRQKLVVYLL